MAISTYDQVFEMTPRLDLPEQLQLLENLPRMIRNRVPSMRPHSIMELEGLGAEIWQDIDAQSYVDEEQVSWKPQ